jgi:hypothetical protein
MEKHNFDLRTLVMAKGQTCSCMLYPSSKLDGTFAGQFYIVLDKFSSMSSQERKEYIKQELPFIHEDL